MRRFLVPPEAWGIDAIQLPAAEAHHALRVLRLKPGDRVTLFDGAGREVDAEIVSLTAQGGEARPVGELREATAGLRLVLGQGLPKGDKLEQILQHATELGVSEVVPLALARSVTRLEPEKMASRRERWRRIGAEAAKQCRRSDLPEVAKVSSIEEFCRRFEADRGARGLVLYEEATGLELRAVMEAWPESPASIWVLIGPEGGLTAGEVARAKQAGFELAGLGPRILRTETAGLAVLAILQYVWGSRSHR